MRLIKKRIAFCLLIIITLISLILIINYKLKPSDLLTSKLQTDIPVTAKSAIVMERKSKRVLFEKNAHMRLLTASIAKILTCITAIENLDLERYIVVDETILQATGSRIYLECGEVIRIRDLLYGVMLQSGNDASLMVAKSYSGNLDDFIYRMNELAKTLQMTNSSFNNPTGLDETTKNYSTAYDMALLMAYAMDNKTFRNITKTKKYTFENSDGKKYYLANKHRLIQEEDNVIGGKTGYTKKAGRTLVTVFKREEMELIIVTFDAHSDWQLHKNLANQAFNTFQMLKVLSPFTFQMSTFNYLDNLTIKNSIYFPLQKEEEVTRKLRFKNDEIYLVLIIDRKEYEVMLELIEVEK